MKYQKIFLVFILASLLLILPLFEPTHEITATQYATNSIVIEVHNPIIKIDTQINSTVKVSIFWLNPISNTSEIIATNLSLNNHLDVNILKSGLYLLNFNTTQLGIISIRGYGLFLPSIIVVSVALLIGLVILYDFLQKSMY